MPRRLLVVAALLVLCLGAPSPAGAADCPAADAVPAAENLPTIGQATLCLVNEQRAARGLRALRENARLTSASARYSQRMVTQAFFDHEAPDGTTLVQRLTAVGYLAGGDDWVVGENIGWGQGPLSTPRAMVDAWMNSPGHRRNILASDYAEIGLGLAMGTPRDASWGATYTTDFGKPAKKAKRRRAVARAACARSAQSRKRARFAVAVLSYSQPSCSGRRAQQSSRSSSQH